MNGTTERELAEHTARLLASPKGILPESIAREAMAYALTALDDPTVPSPDFAGPDADPAETIRDGDTWMLDEHGQPEPVGNGVDPFDPRETDRMRRDFIEDRMDAQTEVLEPLPRHVDHA